MKAQIEQRPTEEVRGVIEWLSSPRNKPQPRAGGQSGGGGR
jgi:hypothetical protein